MGFRNDDRCEKGAFIEWSGKSEMLNISCQSQVWLAKGYPFVIFAEAIMLGPEVIDMCE